MTIADKLHMTLHVCTSFTLVKEFQRKFKLPCRSRPQLLPSAPHDDFAAIDALGHIRNAEAELRDVRTAYPDDQFYGRVQMMLEEIREMVEAQIVGDLPTVADSLIDLEYFVLGTSAMMGLPHDEIFAEVHRANMDKVLVESAEESKRLNKLDVKKPEGWQPPDVARIIEQALAREADDGSQG